MAGGRVHGSDLLRAARAGDRERRNDHGQQHRGSVTVDGTNSGKYGIG
jgi:hypothetical protein